MGANFRFYSRELPVAVIPLTVAAGGRGGGPLGVAHLVDDEQWHRS